MDEIIKVFNDTLIKELSEEYPDVYFNEKDLVFALEKIFVETDDSFIFIIDGWDSVWSSL